MRWRHLAVRNSSTLRLPLIHATVTIALVGYNWMGVGLLFASIALLFDIVQIFLEELSQGTALLGIIGLTLVASVYGFIEARRVRVLVLKVQSPKLEYEDKKPFRIVQISDLHLGYGTLPGQVRIVVEKVGALNPDLLVSSGDLFDTNLDNLGSCVELIKTIKPPRGKIAITGNNEVYAGLTRALELTEESGFQVLRSNSVKVGTNLFIAGVDDPEALDGKPSEEAEKEALQNVSDSAFKILLKQRPNISPSTVDKFDLQL